MQIELYRSSLQFRIKAWTRWPSCIWSMWLEHAAHIIEIVPHRIQWVQAPISALLLTTLLELNATVLHSLSTNTCTASLEFMHKTAHLVIVHTWLVQQLGDLADDMLAILAEERDNIVDEVWGAPFLEHLQLLELIVQQTLSWGVPGACPRFKKSCIFKRLLIQREDDLSRQPQWPVTRNVLK